MLYIEAVREETLWQPFLCNKMALPYTTKKK
jgi:hypothetical protein